MNWIYYFAILVAAVAGVSGGAAVWYLLILPRLTDSGAAAVSATEVFKEYHRKRRERKATRRPVGGGV